tara:strand:- start:406 stop:630 length:225 start_codon:yes stop_codon:yes gene_type:complete
MKVFTNKYPVLGLVTMNADCTIDKEGIKVEFKEGKVFKVLGTVYDDFILECEGKVVAVRAHVFAISFTETDLSI